MCGGIHHSSRHGSTTIHRGQLPRDARCALPVSTKVPPLAQRRALPRERNDGRVRTQRCHRRMRARPHRSPGRRFLELDATPGSGHVPAARAVGVPTARAQAPTPPPPQPAPAPGAQEKAPEPTTEGLGLDLTEDAKKPSPSTVVRSQRQGEGRAGARRAVAGRGRPGEEHPAQGLPQDPPLRAAPHHLRLGERPVLLEVGRCSLRGSFFLSDTLAVAVHASIYDLLPTDDVRTAKANFQSRIFYSVPKWSVAGRRGVEPDLRQGHHLQHHHPLRRLHPRRAGRAVERHLLDAARLQEPRSGSTRGPNIAAEFGHRPALHDHRLAEREPGADRHQPTWTSRRAPTRARSRTSWRSTPASRCSSRSGAPGGSPSERPARRRGAAGRPRRSAPRRPAAPARTLAPSDSEAGDTAALDRDIGPLKDRIPPVTGHPFRHGAAASRSRPPSASASATRSGPSTWWVPPSPTTSPRPSASRCAAATRSPR